jgi:hypothetical protein
MFARTLFFGRINVSIPNVLVTKNCARCLAKISEKCPRPLLSPLVIGESAGIGESPPESFANDITRQIALGRRLQLFVQIDEAFVCRVDEGTIPGAERDSAVDLQDPIHPKQHEICPTDDVAVEAVPRAWASTDLFRPHGLR